MERRRGRERDGLQKKNRPHCCARQPKTIIPDGGGGFGLGIEGEARERLEQGRKGSGRNHETREGRKKCGPRRNRKKEEREGTICIHATWTESVEQGRLAMAADEQRLLSPSLSSLGAIIIKNISASHQK